MRYEKILTAIAKQRSAIASVKAKYATISDSCTTATGRKNIAVAFKEKTRAVQQLKQGVITVKGSTKESRKLYQKLDTERKQLQKKKVIA